MKTVAVIIPVYNMEKYLKECLDSVIAQTLKNFEIICINDGSTDGSLNILQEYSKKNESLTVIDQKNQGVWAARNVGILSANAEYVCFMDPDDFYPDNKVLEDLYEGAKAHNALICGGSFSIYNDITKEKTVEFNGFDKRYTFLENAVIPYTKYQFDYGYHRFLYSLQLLKTKKIEFPPYRRFQDPPFFVKAMIAAKEFYAIKRVVYGYRCGHHTIKWDEEKVLAVMSGLCDNLKISAEYCLYDLHAVTLQRIIDCKEIFEINKIENMSEEFRNKFFQMVMCIRMDLIEKSTQDINVNQLFRVFNGALLQQDIYRKELEEWKYQYNCIRNSRTFRFGEVILYIPKKLYYLIFKRKRAA